MFLKPFKWLILSGAMLGAAGYLLLGTDFGSYFGTVVSSVKESIQGKIPVEFELKRAEKLISAIDPQIDTCKRDVARAEVELDELQGSVINLEKVVNVEERKLKTGARLLSGDGSVEYTFASDHLDRRRVEFALQRTLDSYKNNQAILKAKRALIVRQTEAVAVAKERLNSVRAERETLAEQVQALRVQQQQVETLAAHSKHFTLDDSALGQAKEVLEKIRGRLALLQKMAENEIVFHSDETVTAAQGRDVLKEISDQFSGGAVTADLGAPSVVVSCQAGH